MSEPAEGDQLCLGSFKSSAAAVKLLIAPLSQHTSGKGGNFSPLTAQYEIKWEIAASVLSFVSYTQTQAAFSATWHHHFQAEVGLSCPQLLCVNLELGFKPSMAIIKMKLITHQLHTGAHVSNGLEVPEKVTNRIRELQNLGELRLGVKGGRD